MPKVLIRMRRPYESVSKRLLAAGIGVVVVLIAVVPHLLNGRNCLQAAFRPCGSEDRLSVGQAIR